MRTPKFYKVSLKLKIVIHPIFIQEVMVLLVWFTRGRRSENIADLLTRHVASPITSKASCFYIVYVDILLTFFFLYLLKSVALLDYYLKAIHIAFVYSLVYILKDTRKSRKSRQPLLTPTFLLKLTRWSFKFLWCC